MEAALGVIADRGLAATRISDIAERAGMSPGHVMYYFRSKDLVLMEALRFVEDRMHEEVGAELAAIAPGPKRLRRLLELNMPDGPADPGWALWLEAWTLAPHDESCASSSPSSRRGGCVCSLTWSARASRPARSGATTSRRPSRTSTRRSTASRCRS